MPEDPRSRRRLQTAAERDAASAEARKVRERGYDLAAPDEVHDPVTGVLEGDDLRRARAARPTDQRLEILENKHDELVRRTTERHEELSKRMGKVEVAVSNVGGQMQVIPSLVETMNKAIDAMTQRQHVTLSAQVEVEKAIALEQVEANRDERKDELKARNERRKRMSKVIGAVLGLLGSGTLLGYILSRIG